MFKNLYKEIFNKEIKIKIMINNKTCISGYELKK